MNNKLYEITLDETQLTHLQNALKCHVVKLVEDWFEDDTSEVPEEVAVVQDMYHVLKDFTNDDFTLEEPFSKTQELMWIKEIDLDEQCKKVEELRLEELLKNVEKAKQALNTFTINK